MPLRLAVRDIALFERAVRFARPFRFGAVVVEAASVNPSDVKNVAGAMEGTAPDRVRACGQGLDGNGEQFGVGSIPAEADIAAGPPHLDADPLGRPVDDDAGEVAARHPGQPTDGWRSLQKWSPTTSLPKPSPTRPSTPERRP